MLNTLFLGEYESAVTERLKQLTADRFVARLWQHDPSLWKPEDPAAQRSIRNRLGWLATFDSGFPPLDRINTFVESVKDAGFRDAVLFGMGGSSLAPELFADTFADRAGYPRLHVLDDTSPEAVDAVEKRIDLGRTLFIVSSKSGTTVETLSFYRHFTARLRASEGAQTGDQFIAITDPGTPLERLAREQGFRDLFLNPPDIGGRYSALSLFGLVPAALVGVDIALVLDAARALARRCAAEPARNPGVYLGAALGELALHGRDKLTLWLAPGLRGLGAWVEQLVAESTGKEGRGIVPVDAEPPGAAADYGSDRVFVVMDTGDERWDDTALLTRLQAAGHPLLYWTLPDRHALGAEFLRWEIATATAGSVLGINPFDEPNVTESKDTTRALLDEFEQSGRLPEETPQAGDHDLQLFGTKTGTGVVPVLAEFLAGIKAGDYLALLVYMQRTSARHRALTELRTRLRDHFTAATTLGYGPRFLHSTGQLHKGGADNGVFVQITADPDTDLGIPEAAYSFGDLHRAQALGDYRVLRRRGRRVLRVHLVGDIDTGLAALASRVETALANEFLSQRRKGAEKK